MSINHSSLKMNNYPTYPEYKDSGVEWLGEIPKSWELRRLGSYFQERRSKVSDKDFAPLSVTKQGILPQLATAAKTNDGDNRKLVLEGDFVINSRSDRKGSSGVALQDGSVSLINIVMEPQSVYPPFCNYLLKGNAFVEEYYRNGHGIVADLWTTRYDEMKNIKIGMPSEAEQIAIADFLDDKVSKINEAIAQKEQLIQLLNERKQIVIQSAVTGGWIMVNDELLMVNGELTLQRLAQSVQAKPNEEGIYETETGEKIALHTETDRKIPVINHSKLTINHYLRVKDSQIPWIGKIPEHWEVIQFRRILNKVEQGDSPSLSNDDTEHYVLKLSAISGGKYIPHKEKTISQKHYVEKFQLQKGDFLMTRGNTPELVADTCIITNCINYKVMFSDLVYRLHFNEKVVPEFILNSCQSAYMRMIIKSYARGSNSTMSKVSQDSIKSFSILLPPKVEQLNIVTYIENETSNIDKAISQAKLTIDKLKEYKATLINSAVTGKVKIV